MLPFIIVNRYKHECTTYSLIIMATEMLQSFFTLLDHDTATSNAQPSAGALHGPPASVINDSNHASPAWSIPAQCFCKNNLVPSFNSSKLAFSNSTATAAATEAHFSAFIFETLE